MIIIIVLVSSFVGYLQWREYYCVKKWNEYSNCKLISEEEFCKKQVPSICEDND